MGGDVMGDIERWECRHEDGSLYWASANWARRSNLCPQCGRELELVGYVRADAYRAATEALREIANLPHSGADDSRAVAAERARIARKALHQFGGR